MFLLMLGHKSLLLPPGSPRMLALGLVCPVCIPLGPSVTLGEAHTTWRKHILVLQLIVAVLSMPTQASKQVSKISR